jgi:hypothetical protein
MVNAKCFAGSCNDLSGCTKQQFDWAHRRKARQNRAKLFSRSDFIPNKVRYMTAALTWSVLSSIAFNKPRYRVSFTRDFGLFNNLHKLQSKEMNYCSWPASRETRRRYCNLRAGSKPKIDWSDRKNLEHLVSWPTVSRIICYGGLATS